MRILSTKHGVCSSVPWEVFWYFVHLWGKKIEQLNYHLNVGNLGWHKPSSFWTPGSASYR
jgi:hypothetical protein